MWLSCHRSRDVLVNSNILASGHLPELQEMTNGSGVTAGSSEWNRLNFHS